MSHSIQWEDITDSLRPSLRRKKTLTSPLYSSTSKWRPTIHIHNKTLKHTEKTNDKTAFKAKQNITQAKTANQQTEHKTAKHQRNKVRQIPTFRQFSIFWENSKFIILMYPYLSLYLHYNFKNPIYLWMTSNWWTKPRITSDFSQCQWLKKQSQGTLVALWVAPTLSTFYSLNFSSLTLINLNGQAVTVSISTQVTCRQCSTLRWHYRESSLLMILSNSANGGLSRQVILRETLNMALRTLQDHWDKATHTLLVQQ